MKIKPIGNHQTLVFKDDGTVILISYVMPVAAYIPGKAFVRTDQFYSRTTSRHIQEFVKDCDIVSQEFLDGLMKETTDGCAE
jgi:hypothetical protein